MVQSGEAEGGESMIDIGQVDGRVAASVGPEGRPVLAGFPDEDVEIGARLK